MPELAEVEYFRRQWGPGVGKKVLATRLHSRKRVFRGVNTTELKRALSGAKFLRSESRGKQMMCVFSGDVWLGLHLGMSGSLHRHPAGYIPQKHDHLAIVVKNMSLVFRDPRMFGRIRLHRGKAEPVWWSKVPPAVASPQFTLARMNTALARRKGAPLKGILLAQEIFPGVGNWMADEILWQANIHPRATAGQLTSTETKTLWKTARAVCRVALRSIGADWSNPPKTWLIHARWKKSGLCPKHGTALQHATVAGRTTAWCPKCQPERRR